MRREKWIHLIVGDVPQAGEPAGSAASERLQEVEFSVRPIPNVKTGEPVGRFDDFGQTRQCLVGRDEVARGKRRFTIVSYKLQEGIVT